MQLRKEHARDEPFEAPAQHSHVCAFDSPAAARQEVQQGLQVGRRAGSQAFRPGSMRRGRGAGARAALQQDPRRGLGVIAATCKTR
jgi:hypothetical protein